MAKILVIEDEYDISSTLEMLLSDEGYEVVIAQNGQEALDRLSEIKPDLIISDIMMPFKNGYDTLEQIRTLPEYHLTPYILMSAGGAPDPARKPEWNYFFKKPFNIYNMLEVVAKLLKDSSK
ncbi:response regulator [Peredibacter starrii]|uniref:Response regulator n=1 Tax=Peredibacter starrii TaxID=28202 RepID=A0AAX4HT39_9BACT|nr:response regulator [Peredibacter starrii]WPU66499.1 response regulator [Peredibacter starrii]